MFLVGKFYRGVVVATAWIPRLARCITATNSLGSFSLNHLRFCKEPSYFAPIRQQWYTDKTVVNMSTGGVDLTKFDETQVKLLDEMCIVVDENDNVIGKDTKKNCHLLKNITERNLLHRAFSVFLFDASNKKLLLQQRSDEKITFPGEWTNSCCSHPLSRAEEMCGADGVKCAARRRLQYELGVEERSISVDDMRYLTRIHYKAASDQLWAEHEIDYVIFINKDQVKLNINANEIKHHKYVSPDELKQMIRDEVPMTPWFKLICDTKLFDWWENLEDLADFQDHKTIHRMK